jgi:Tfp pilus assembly protein PilV
MSVRNPATPIRHPAAFTLVEVMMAAMILTVGFIGMIEAVVTTSKMMAMARQQTLASQILNNEIESLRLATWTTISVLPVSDTSMAIDRQMWPAWNGGTSYIANNVVTYNGAWYRCTLAPSGQSPTDAGFWTPATSGLPTDIVTASGATFSLSRSCADVASGSLRQITFTVTWVIKSSRRDNNGLPVVFTYRRNSSAWFGKYGLNLTYQRS